ncbi:MAG: cadmium-translocating P-type ATPase [Butyricicoccus sp.]|nr:cadmium-translocating P-type ATPase [Butyricicoccus sp.]
MGRKQKKALLRIILGAALFIAACLLPLKGWARGLVFLAPYLFIGWDVLWNAVKNLAHGQLFDEKFLMALATVGAFGIGEYPEAVFVMLFFQIGELFEGIAVGKSRKSISELMDIRPDCANVERGGEIFEVDPDEVAVGEIIVVKPGEKAPIDGVVVEGASSLNTTALTGESLPRDVGVGDAVVSGCVNLNGLLRIRTTRQFGESTVAKILELVENSAASKSRSENFIARFAHWYTPCVVAGAALLAVVPPLIVGGWSEWIHRALIFLVISCPCALVISVPLTFFGGIGAASKQGILIKGSNYMDALTHAELAVMDKTGTLTKGSFSVTQARPSGCTRERLLELAALAEAYSDHPIAQSLRRAWGGECDKQRVSGVEETAGHGVRALVDGAEVFCGNERLMSAQGITPEHADETGTAVHVAAGGEYAGYVVISDELKPGAAEAVAGMKAQGIRKTVMLSGDARAAAEKAAAELGIDEVHAELLPGDKVERVESLLAETSAKGKLMFVGDGINDAPVLSRADIGIAMGALGSDAAIEAADIVLMDDKPGKIVTAMQIARRTKRIVMQNIVFALAVKFGMLILGALGYANMWEASFADVGVCVIAVLNAMRALKFETPEQKNL